MMRTAWPSWAAAVGLWSARDRYHAIGSRYDGG
jgi:hypothetical protein